jgi:3'-5' exonuclease
MERIIFIDIETLPDGNPADHGPLKKGETEDEAYRRRALDSMRGKILCIGWACGDEGWVINGSDEEATLQQFSAILDGIMGRYKQMVTFVGWNIKSFDLAWIWRKSVKYRLPNLRQSILRDRYKGNAIDLMEIWASDFKDYRKQSDVAAFLGIEDRSNGIDGSMIYDLYKEGRIEEIKTYCMSDVECVREIYKRIYE